MPDAPPSRLERRRLVAGAALAALALASFVLGALAGGGEDDGRRDTAAAFARAWQDGDTTAMYGLLTPAAQERTSARAFARAYRDAAEVTTLTEIRAAAPRSPEDGAVAVPVAYATRIFGTIRADLRLPVVELEDDQAGVEWSRELVFPGLRRGEELGRTTRMPARAAIEARDGTPLAEGEERLSDLGSLAAEVAGRVGPAPPERRRALRRRGIPDDTPVGLTGLERQFEEQLAGTPGGTLTAGGRIVANSSPKAGRAVTTTIDPDIQRAAVDALAGRYGGVAVMHPETGEVLALAGIATANPQPPGSTFKIITLAAALAAGTATSKSAYPFETAATIEGVELENANGESCGGSLRDAFAESCNSVFAPLGARTGAKALVTTAERLGFNAEPPIAGAARSTIPAADEIGDDLAVGSTAIGQGKVLATPLLMAGVAAAIAEEGVLVRPTLRKGADPERGRAIEAPVARTVARLMRAVVTDGTGVAAALPGVQVAGKTGTAELRDTTNQDPLPGDPDAPPPEDDPTDTDAWFAAFAPYERPRVAVAVMLVGAGAGGDTAAPVAREVLRSALRR